MRRAERGAEKQTKKKKRHKQKKNQQRKRGTGKEGEKKKTKSKKARENKPNQKERKHKDPTERNKKDQLPNEPQHVRARMLEGRATCSGNGCSFVLCAEMHQRKIRATGMRVSH